MQTPEGSHADIDPTGYHTAKGATPDNLVEACGLLLGWALYATKNGLPIREHMESSYGFPLYQMEGGVVDTMSGAYTYPEDPTLMPILTCTGVNGEKVHVYQYAIVAFIAEDGSTFITRMD
jgi:hypothetical protein